MVYLLTQIVFSLALAGLLGAAVGWLLNGYRASGRENHSKSELLRQAQALRHAETDKKMMEDDFRELKQRAEESITLLKEDTQQIPELKNNLEQSQTLVRQMLQKHDAELRQLASNNSVLNGKLRELENREKAVTQLQIDLNTERLKMRSDNSPERRSGTSKVNLAQTRDVPASPSNNVEGNTVSGDPASVQPTMTFGQTTQKTPRSQDHYDGVAATTNAVYSNDQTGHPADKHRAQLSNILTEQTEIPLDSTPETARSIDDILDKADHVLTRFRDDPSMELESFQIELDQELHAIRQDLITNTQAIEIEIDDVPDNDQVPGTQEHHKEQHQAEPDSHDLAVALANCGIEFATAQKQDQLQQIFGIGPVTENTLNAMGITSFEQIAQFEREHIEYVAEVLQIFPGRIERDNWVDSARTLVASADNHPDTANRTSAELEDA